MATYTGSIVSEFEAGLGMVAGHSFEYGNNEVQFSIGDEVVDTAIILEDQMIQMSNGDLYEYTEHQTAITNTLSSGYFEVSQVPVPAAIWLFAAVLPLILRFKK